jgi:hypothetical protein
MGEKTSTAVYACQDNLAVYQLYATRIGGSEPDPRSRPAGMKIRRRSQDPETRRAVPQSL